MGGKFDKNCQHHTDEDDDHGDDDHGDEDDDHGVEDYDYGDKNDDLDVDAFYSFNQSCILPLSEKPFICKP